MFKCVQQEKKKHRELFTNGKISCGDHRITEWFGLEGTLQII